MPVNPVSAENTAPTTKNTDRPHCTLAPIGGKHQQHEEDQHHEHAERAELAPQIGRGALLHGQGDLLHLGCALAGGEHFPHQQARHGKREQRDHCDDHNQGQVAAGYSDRPTACGEVMPCH